MKLTQKNLKEILHYDPETGLAVWRISTRVHKKGEQAGSRDVAGYRQISIDYKKYRLHRLAFLYVLGRWPKGEVDHANLNKQDDSWKNLREASISQNRANVSKNKLNKSGYKGVVLDARVKSKPWLVQCQGKFIGRFRTAENAATAYNLAAWLKFGKFARINV